MKSADLDYDADEFEVTLNSETTVYFTHTHLAEVQAILSLIDEYGLPNEQFDEELYESESITSGPLGYFSRTEKEVKEEQFEKPKLISDTGAKVNHRVYGNGIVSSCFGDRITVNFDNGKETTFDLKVCQKSGIINLV